MADRQRSQGICGGWQLKAMDQLKSAAGNIGLDSIRKKMNDMKMMMKESRVDFAKEQRDWRRLQQVDDMEGFNQSRSRSHEDSVSKEFQYLTELKRRGNFEIVQGSSPNPNTTASDGDLNLGGTTASGSDLILGVTTASGSDLILGGTSASNNRDLTLEEKVLNLFQEDGVGVVGIHGVRGAGKTTLLNKIKTLSYDKKWKFDAVILVVVSRDVNITEKTQRAIGDRLALCFTENESLKEKATKLIKVLKKKKKCMLLLDGVWEPLNLEVIGIPHDCKIVFTTRNIDVCIKMSVDEMIAVDVLQQKEAWELFRKKVGADGILDSPLIQPVAVNITKICRGLPLALITIGRAMAEKTTVEEWKNAEKLLHKLHTTHEGVQDEFLPLLKFSYDNLDGDQLKSCFLYCSLFPKDYSIDVDDLVNYWMGEGFLDEHDDVYAAREKGYRIIRTLKDAFLLEVENQVKMHDMLRDLALWIASECGEKKEKFLLQCGLGLCKPPGVRRWKEAERISLMKNDFDELIEAPTCLELLTLMLNKNRQLNNISYGFFQFMPRLQVLDLSFTNLKEFPAEISMLSELRYLNLSYTKITKFTSNLWNLVKLKYLNVSNTYYLEPIPREAIEGQLRLKVLNLYESSASNWSKLSFFDLEDCNWLHALGITINMDYMLEFFLSSTTLSQRTQFLAISGFYNSRTMHLWSKFLNLVHLQEFSIRDCDRLEELIIGKQGENMSLPSLKLFILSRLPNLKAIVVSSYECLKYLRHLHIFGCHELKNVTWVRDLPYLERLELINGKGMEEVIGRGVGQFEVLPSLHSLKWLKMERLPKLKSFYLHSLSFWSLKELAVNKCPNLKKLPLKHRSTNNELQVIYGQKSWWDQLKWEADSIKYLFLPFFVELEEDAILK